MSDTLSGKRCAALLERAADWLDANRNVGECDNLEVTYGDVINSPFAYLYVVTPQLDLVLRTSPNSELLHHDDGPLAIKYGNLSRQPKQDRPSASAPVRALAALALDLPLPIYRVCGSFLDASWSCSPSLTIECAFGRSPAEQQQLDEYLGPLTATADRFGDYEITTTQPGQDGLPVPYLARLSLLPVRNDTD